MGLAIEQWLGLLCLCAFGIQNSFSFIAEQREMRSECTKNIGHFCINVIPPPAPKKRRPKVGKGKRRGFGKGRGLGAAGGRGRNIPTKTRRGGRRPSPAELGAANNRLPSSANTQPAYQGYQPRPVQQPRWVQPPQSVAQWVPPPAATAPPPINNGWFFGNYFGGLFGNAPAADGTPQNNAANNAFAWSFISRKKRQAAEAPEPGDYGYVPRIRRNQGQYEFLNLHCLKTDVAMIECRSSGSVCCQPRP